MRVSFILTAILFSFGVASAQSPAQPPPTPKGSPGQPSQPPKGMEWSPEKCEKQIPKVKKAADNCLRLKAENKRKQCFDKLGNNFPPGFSDSCKAQLEPLKAEMEAKEKEKYPNQNSGMPQGEPKGPAQPGQENPPTGKGPQGDKKMDCGKLIAEVKKHAEQCLSMKDQGKRKACFDKVGQKIQESGAEQMCGDAMNMLKAEFQAKEAQMYPGQPASIQ